MDYENQKMLEMIFNNKQARPLLLRELHKNTEAMDLLHNAEEASNGFLTMEFMEDIMVHLMQAKRATVPALVGMFKFHFSGVTAHQTAAVALAGIIHLGLVTYDDERTQLVVKYDASEHAHDLIRQYMYLPPMIVPPLAILDGSNNRGSGYITETKDSLLLQNNHHDGELCVDHLNRSNQVALCINETMVKTLRNHWKGVEALKDGETFEDFKKRVKAFEQYEKDSFMIIALMLEMGNKFYLTHKYDKRGRTYAQGYQINTQGNPWNKSCVELANKEIVQ